MRDELRVGIVGAGGIVAQRHLPGLAKIDGVRIGAVANSTPESAWHFCEEQGLRAQVFERWEDLVISPEIDVVWIGATPYLHRPATLAALEAGKHVFCQARMALDLAEAREMLAASEAHPDLVTMLCPPPMGLRHDAFVRSLIDNGELGEIRRVELQSLNGAFRDPSLPAHWRQRKEISGLNILTLGIYTEVLQRWLGDFDEVRASGRIAAYMRGGYRVKVPEELDVNAHFARGTIGKLHFSGIFAGRPTERIEITGSLRALRYDFPAETFSSRHAGSLVWEPLEPPAGPERPWRVERDFIDAVRNPDAPRPRPTFRDGVAYMRVVEAVNVSLSAKKAVPVETPN